MENLVYIYALKCPETNIIKYVGKSYIPKRRYIEHLSKSRNDKCRSIPLYGWINELLNNNLKPILEILEECETKIWAEKEKEWIAKFGISNLLNRNHGGFEPPNTNGLKWTDEQKQNHPSHNRKGKPQWIDTPHPLLGKKHPAKGQKRTKEFCNLMREQRRINNGMKGVKLSDERIEQIKKANSIKVALIDDYGNILKEYSSQKEAAIELNLDSGAIVRVCKGEYKQTKGYKFKYL